MGIKRSVIGVVTMAAAAGAVAVGLTTATPDVYYDMHGNHGVTRPIVATDSATTPNVYYDM